MTSYKNCQSCGMALAKDGLGGGTEKDKTPKFIAGLFTKNIYKQERRRS